MPVRYAEELNCVGCSLCCRGWRVEVDDLGEHKTPQHLTTVDEENGVTAMKRKENGACIALDEERNACTIYENRPQVCRDFERGSRACWKKIKDEGEMERFMCGSTPLEIPA